MSIELKVPSVGESIYEVTIGEWLKAEGDWVNKDEPLVALETDKASLEVPAPQAGLVSKHVKQPGDSAEIGEVIGLIDTDVPRPAGAPAAATTPVTAAANPAAHVARADGGGHVMPAAQRLLSQHGVDPTQVARSGPGGRMLKEDVQAHVAKPPPAPAPAPAGPLGAREEQVVRMTPLRKRIAQRLVQSQQESATLTTFNEVDMSQVMALRKEYKQSFLDRYGIKLGFMSFFVKATIEALKLIPELNAEISGPHIIYRNYYDIGIAVGGGRGLVVPVIRSAERLSFAEVELTIADFGRRAQTNKIAPQELQGGTFTISNGGVYGSLLSTPIINPPQVGILGMHNIVPRPVAIDGRIEIRPMMYVALSYDHRLIDGRESVTFLKRIKECVENPSRILLEV